MDIEGTEWSGLRGQAVQRPRGKAEPGAFEEPQGGWCIQRRATQRTGGGKGAPRDSGGRERPCGDLAGGSLTWVILAYDGRPLDAFGWGSDMLGLVFEKVALAA